MVTEEWAHRSPDPLVFGTRGTTAASRESTESETTHDNKIHNETSTRYGNAARPERSARRMMCGRSSKRSGLAGVQSGLRRLDEGAERGKILYSKICKDLAVNRDVSELEAMN